MINLEEIKPDFTGTWFQKQFGTEISGDFKIYIIDFRKNKFFGVKVDKNGIAEIEGEFYENKTIFCKVYARYVTETTNAAKMPIAYNFECNIFEMKEGETKSGFWSFIGYPEGNKVNITALTNLQRKTNETVPESSDLENRDSASTNDTVDDLPF